MRQPSLFLLKLPEKGWTKNAVLFPVQARGRGVILATCAHTVNHIEGQYNLIICDTDGNELPEGPPIKTMLLPPELGADLALMEVQMDQVPSLVKFSTDPIQKDTTLFHARNVMRKPGFEGQNFVVTEQKSSVLPRSYACIMNHYHEKAELARQGVSKIPCPQGALAMRSWPGVSGSPIWNQHGRTIGMVCGGNEELTETNPEFFMVFLPAEMIKKALAQFLR